MLKKLVLFVFGGVMGLVAGPLYALVISPTEPVTLPGGTVEFTATENTGAVNWFDLDTSTLLGSGNTLTYTAPADAGIVTLEAKDELSTVPLKFNGSGWSKIAENDNW